VELGPVDHPEDNLSEHRIDPGQRTDQISGRFNIIVPKVGAGRVYRVRVGGGPRRPDALGSADRT
jgi:hypothetical protein